MESEYLGRNFARMFSQKENASKCICFRPYSNVICNSCGYWTKGRVRYCCPKHPQIIFLHDITGCPRCKSYDFMLKEI